MNALYVHTFPFCPLSSTQTGVYPFYFILKKQKSDTVKRWLKAISLSEKQEFRNFVPPLTNETFKLFVQFFWLIKVADGPKATQLVFDIRRQWGIENWIYEDALNEFLASGDATTFTASPWLGQVTHFTRKRVSGISAL